MEIKVKISELISRVREILKDPSKSYYTDAAIASGIVDAIRRLHSRRPCTRYAGQYITEVEFPKGDSLINFEVSLDERFHLGVVYFAAARCYEGDLKDLVHQQMSIQLKQMADAEFAM